MIARASRRASTTHAAAPPADARAQAPPATATPAGAINALPDDRRQHRVTTRHAPTRIGLRRRDEPVAAAAHGFDHPVRAERLQREAQPADVDVDRALLDVDVIAPHLVEQLRARVHALGPRQEEAQQPEFGGPERDLGPADGHAMRRRDRASAGPATSGSCAASGARRAQHRLDPRLELARARTAS